MNDADLDKTLRSAPVPERPGEYWEDFPGRVTRELRRREDRPESSVRRRTPRPAWAWGLACACFILIGVLAGRWMSNGREPSFALSQNGKVIRETLAMFPNQVRAIEQDENGIRVVLSEHPDVPASTPLWIRICEGGRCRAVVTFSGQHLQIAKETVEVLADAQGQIILVGDRLFWSNANITRGTDHLRIRARPLTYAL